VFQPYINFSQVEILQQPLALVNWNEAANEALPTIHAT